MLAQNVPFPESSAIWKATEDTTAGPVFSADEASPSTPLRLSAHPNPSTAAVYFTINQPTLPASCLLKIMAPNGKPLLELPAVSQPMELPSELAPGFYIAVLAIEHTERVLAHCTFIINGE